MIFALDGLSHAIGPSAQHAEVSRGTLNTYVFAALNSWATLRSEVQASCGQPVYASASKVRPDSDSVMYRSSPI